MFLMELLGFCRLRYMPAKMHVLNGHTLAHTREMSRFWSSSRSKSTISVLSSTARCAPSPALHLPDYSTDTRTYTRTHCVLT